MQDPVELSLEFTPNPNTLKYVVNRLLLESGAASFTTLEAAKNSPLAQKLLNTPGLVGVMIGRNFITVTKADDGEWEKIHNQASELVKTHLENNEAVVTGDLRSAPVNHAQASGEIESKIKEILDAEIRPAVAMDGGDITFDKYENGTVYLFLQGSCSGCPSSTMTLKMGIEARLKEMIPEIQDVVAI
jgi:Fe-S cluster biogenesis protein NfuA